MSFILLGILNSQAAGAGGFAYYLGLLGSANNDILRGVAVNEAGESFYAGEIDSPGDADFTASYDSSASIRFQNKLGGAGGTGGAESIALDSANNFYTVGESGFPREGQIVKYNSSGVVQWQRSLSGDDDIKFVSVAVDSNDDVYALAESNATQAGTVSTLYFVLVKYNSAGVLQFQKYYEADTVTGEASQPNGLAIDSSNNIYMIGTGIRSTSDSFRAWLIIKTDSSGTLTYARQLGIDGNSDSGQRVAIDSNDDVYLTGVNSGQLTVAKYNSGGTIQWQRQVGSSEETAITIDLDDNVFATARTSVGSAGSSDLLFIKYNTSGTLQYQRLLGGANSETPTDLASNSNAMYFAAFGSSGLFGSNDLFFGALPKDGSLTGTYVLNGENFIYQNGSSSESAASLNSASTSVNTGNSSFTDATTSLSAAAVSLSESIAIL